MKILAIETSCDETAAAVVENGRNLLSNVVATQIELHSRYGGVFPEVASRQHVLAIQPVIRQALDMANLRASDLDALAVTNGPGLAGSLLVGVNAAKGMALAAGKPLYGVNHLEGHIYSNWVRTAQAGDEIDDDRFPAVVLIVSGGHTDLLLMTGHCHYVRLGGTLDDAAGEAFDKVARILGLGFPGGPAVQSAAESGDSHRFDLPRALRVDPSHPFDFSFSGIKTAVLNLTRRLEREGCDLAERQLQADIAASFQAAVVDVLVEKSALAVGDHGAQQMFICGGVSANTALRFAAESRFEALGIPLHIPPLALCTDNAAMIGAAAFFRVAHGGGEPSSLNLDVFANLPITSESGE